MATADDIEEKLLCSICLHVLCEPKLLTCGHTFCMRCLHAHITRVRAPEVIKGIFGFRCPVCRDFISAPDRLSPFTCWAAKYKPNYIVQEIVDLRRGKKKRMFQCVFHDGKLVELYCKDCKVAVCDRCVSLQHRTCAEVVELNNIIEQRRGILNQQLAAVSKMTAQCENKRERCDTGKTELNRIEQEATQEIDREYHEVIKKVRLHVLREADRLKQEVKLQCYAGRQMVRTYRGKCEELIVVLRRVKSYLQQKSNESILITESTRQEEARIESTMDKLSRAVQALENPCHFEVGLSLDDTALIRILSNFHLGHVDTIKTSTRAKDNRTVDEAIHVSFCEERQSHNMSSRKSTPIDR